MGSEYPRGRYRSVTDSKKNEDAQRRESRALRAGLSGFSLVLLLFMPRTVRMGVDDVAVAMDVLVEDEALFDVIE